MDLIQTLEHEEIARLNKTIPEFAPGDTVIVSVNVVEGTRKRVQAFEGVVIAKRNRSLNSSFIVRKISSGEGVERTFQTYSPLIASIEVKRRGDVRRAKLYYLRSRSGKSARHQGESWPDAACRRSRPPRSGRQVRATGVAGRRKLARAPWPSLRSRGPAGPRHRRPPPPVVPASIAPAAIRAALRLAAGWQPEIKVERRFIDRAPAARLGADSARPARRADGAADAAHRPPHRPSGPDQLPGGRAEPATPTPIATALREAEEEIGLERGVRRGARQPADLHHRHRLHRHAGRRRWCARRSRSQPDPFEVAEVFEVPLVWLMNPANHQRHAIEVGGVRARVLLDALARAATPRPTAPLLHLGRDRGDAAQSLSLSSA